MYYIHVLYKAGCVTLTSVAVKVMYVYCLFSVVLSDSPSSRNSDPLAVMLVSSATSRENGFSRLKVEIQDQLYCHTLKHHLCMCELAKPVH